MTERLTPEREAALRHAGLETPEYCGGVTEVFAELDAEREAHARTRRVLDVCAKAEHHQRAVDIPLWRDRTAAAESALTAATTRAEVAERALADAHDVLVTMKRAEDEVMDAATKHLRAVMALARVEDLTKSIPQWTDLADVVWLLRTLQAERRLPAPTSAEWERYEAACAAEGKTLSEVARAAWERLARRSKRSPGITPAMRRET